MKKALHKIIKVVGLERLLLAASFTMVILAIGWGVFISFFVLRARLFDSEKSYLPKEPIPETYQIDKAKQLLQRQ